MPTLSKTRLEILGNVKRLVLTKHFNVGRVDHQAWIAEINMAEDQLVRADSTDFEQAMRDLLSKLGSSHTAFYSEQPTTFPSQLTIGATFRNHKDSWMFLDVFEESAAAVAGIKPGQTLQAVDGIACSPSTVPEFGIGRQHSLLLADVNGTNSRTVSIEVPHRKGTKQRPPLVEPKSLSYSAIDNQIGLLKILHFPGALGIRFARTVDAAVMELKAAGCRRLIIDLRGNIGGSLGFVRVASHLCADSRPIGYSLTPKRLESGNDRNDLPRVVMPANFMRAVGTMSRFAFADKSVMLLTQGLGTQSFHGRVAILVNEWTNSAGEMLAAFAAENNLAIIVGQKTRGNVLGAQNASVGGGYWLRLPVFGWYTSEGNCLEGNGVLPDMQFELSPDALTEGVDDHLAQALMAIK